MVVGVASLPVETLALVSALLEWGCMSFVARLLHGLRMGGGGTVSGRDRLRRHCLYRSIILGKPKTLRLPNSAAPWPCPALLRQRTAALNHSTVLSLTKPPLSRLRRPSMTNSGREVILRIVLFMVLSPTWRLCRIGQIGLEFLFEM